MRDGTHSSFVDKRSTPQCRSRRARCFHGSSGCAEGSSGDQGHEQWHMLWTELHFIRSFSGWMTSTSMPTRGSLSFGANTSCLYFSPSSSSRRHLPVLKRTPFCLRSPTKVDSSYVRTSADYYAGCKTTVQLTYRPLPFPLGTGCDRATPRRRNCSLHCCS